MFEERRAGGGKEGTIPEYHFICSAVTGWRRDGPGQRGRGGGQVGPYQEQGGGCHKEETRQREQVSEFFQWLSLTHWVAAPALK